MQYSLSSQTVLQIDGDGVWWVFFLDRGIKLMVFPGDEQAIDFDPIEQEIIVTAGASLCLKFKGDLAMAKRLHGLLGGQWMPEV